MSVAVNIDHLLNPQPQIAPAARTRANSTLSVIELNQLIANQLESAFPMALTVTGEISNLSLATSGHRYFSLKDKDSIISCSLFKNAAIAINTQCLSQLKNGDKVIVKAKLSVYKPRGNYQLIVSTLEKAGDGELAKAFSLLKTMLDEKGYTAQIHKKEIPLFATEIAVISSATGAAIKDVLITLAKRAPFIPITVYPTLVQGQNAVNNIISAIKQAEKDARASVILLVRGGGSLEDLQAFNDEALADIIFATSIPIISGVGHETDFSICDFVADYRAATPTAAAEKASPDKIALLKLLQIKSLRLRQQMMQKQSHLQSNQLARDKRLKRCHPLQELLQKQQRNDEQAQRLHRLIKNQFVSVSTASLVRYNRLQQHNPMQKWTEQQRLLAYKQNQLQNKIQQIILQAQARLTHYNLQLKIFVDTALETRKNKLKQAKIRLELLSPLTILARGYAIIYDSTGAIITRTEQLRRQKQIKVHLTDAVSTLDVTVNDEK